ncbi:MAG TPA: hypothetical protein VMV96_04325 [Acidimicrobiales bacterium]|nr:hypothetical protein [Acidimicrobiales bacterium]
MATATVAAGTTVDVGLVGEHRETGRWVAIGGRSVLNCAFVRPDYRGEVIAQR